MRDLPLKKRSRKKKLAMKRIGKHLGTSKIGLWGKLRGTDEVSNIYLGWNFLYVISNILFLSYHCNLSNCILELLC